MDQLAIARRALQTEIDALTAEIQRLERVRISISPESVIPAAASSSLSRPFVGQSELNAASAAGTVISDGGALQLIREAGRKGIKALGLASQLKKAGLSRPSKEELLATGKVKVSGKGGGTTYTFSG
jgi:hypothetical protein